MVELEVEEVVDSLTPCEKNNGISIENFMKTMIDFGYASDEHKTLLNQIF
jgi:hypothetical protein